MEIVVSQTMGKITFVEKAYLQGMGQEGKARNLSQNRG